MVSSTTSFWWWFLIAFWQFVTKKGVYIWIEIGGVFGFLELWNFRLYLGATWCIYFFGSWGIYLDVFIFLWVVYVRRRHYVFISIIVSCFTCATLAIDLYYEVIHDISLLFSIFVKSRIYFVLLVFSTHAFMCLLSVSGIYRLIQLCYYLHWQLIDSSQVELFLVGHFIVMGCFCNFEHFCFSMCFVMDCQRGSLLGSKDLGSQCIRTSMCNVGKPWSKHLV